MAAIVAAADLDLAALASPRPREALALRPSALPPPRRQIETTSTFKQRKLDLVREGFDPYGSATRSTSTTRGGGAYVRLDGALFREIQSGAIRL